jgi:hypothetical protein
MLVDAAIADPYNVDCLVAKLGTYPGFLVKAIANFISDLGFGEKLNRNVPPQKHMTSLIHMTHRAFTDEAN